MRFRLKYSHIYVFLVTWQFFFFDNSRLRLHPYIFWPIMTAVAVLNLGRIRLQRLHVYNIIAFFYCVLASVISENIDEAFTFLAEIAMYYICMFYIGQNKEMQTKMLDTVLAFSGFHLLMLFIQRLLPEIFDTLSLLLKGVSSTATNAGSGLGAEIMVYTGLTSQSSVISLYLILGVLLSLYKAMSTRKRYFIGISVVFLVGIFLTNRRMNSLCGVLILLMMLSLENRNFLKKICSAMVGAACIGIIGYRNIPGVAGLIDKFEIGIAYNNFLSGRDDVWAVAISLFKSSPWFGIGFCELSNHIDVIHAHNSFLQKLAELGVLGSIIYFLPFFAGLFSGIGMLFIIKRCPNRQSTTYAGAMVVLAFFVYTILISLTEGMFETPIFYFYFKIMLLRVVTNWHRFAL